MSWLASSVRCLLACVACGCVTVPVEVVEARTDRLRDAAMKAFESGDRAAALALNARAFESARGLPADSWRTVENYDDAGLYHYAGRDWRRSAWYQAIAVLLACGTRDNATMFPDYLARLGWAYAKLRPDRDFARVSSNPLVLLDDRELGVASNADIRSRYFMRVPVSGGRPGHVIVRRLDAPRACGTPATPPVSLRSAFP